MRSPSSRQALAFAALGGSVPATPPREFLAEQDQADEDEFNDTWARNLAAAESLRVRQQAADDQVSAERDALGRNLAGRVGRCVSTSPRCGISGSSRC